MCLADHISLFVEGMFDFPRPKTLPTFVKYFLHEGTKFIIVELIPFSNRTAQFMMIVGRFQHAESLAQDINREI